MRPPVEELHLPKTVQIRRDNCAAHNEALHGLTSIVERAPYFAPSERAAEILAKERIREIGGQAFRPADLSSRKGKKPPSKPNSKARRGDRESYQDRLPGGGLIRHSKGWNQLGVILSPYLLPIIRGYELVHLGPGKTDELGRNEVPRKKIPRQK